MITDPASPPLAGGWQPIETAPKDGKDMFVQHPDGSWCVSYWGSIRGVYGLKSKLHCSAGGGEGDFCRDATHWMRPDPPAGDKEQG